MKEIYIKKFYEVRYNDIDPDTGYITTDRIMYIAFTKEEAEMLVNLLTKAWHEETHDPNREFVFRERKLEL